MSAVLEDDGIWCWMSVGTLMDGSVSMGLKDGCMLSPVKIGGKYDCLLLHGCEIGIDIRKGGITACGGSPLEMYGKMRDGGWGVSLLESLLPPIVSLTCLLCNNSSPVAFHCIASHTSYVPFASTTYTKSS